MAQKKKSQSPSQAIASTLSGAFGSGLNFLSNAAAKAPPPQYSNPFPQAMQQSGMTPVTLPSRAQQLGQGMTPQQLRQQAQGKAQLRQAAVNRPGVSGLGSGVGEMEMEGVDTALPLNFFDAISRLTATTGIGDVIGASDRFVQQNINDPALRKMPAQKSSPAKPVKPQPQYTPASQLFGTEGNTLQDLMFGQSNAVFGPRGSEIARANNYRTAEDARAAARLEQANQAAEQQAKLSQPFPLSPTSPTMGEAAASQGGGWASQLLAEIVAPGGVGELAGGAKTLGRGITNTARALQTPAQQGLNVARNIGGDIVRELMNPGAVRAPQNPLMSKPPQVPADIPVNATRPIPQGPAVNIAGPGIPSNKNYAGPVNKLGAVEPTGAPVALSDADLGKTVSQYNGMDEADVVEMITGYRPPPVSRQGTTFLNAGESVAYPTPRTRQIRGTPVPSTGRVQNPYAPSNTAMSPTGPETVRQQLQNDVLQAAFQAERDGRWGLGQELGLPPQPVEDAVNGQILAPADNSTLLQSRLRQGPGPALEPPPGPTLRQDLQDEVLQAAFQAERNQNFPPQPQYGVPNPGEVRQQIQDEMLQAAFQAEQANRAGTIPYQQLEVKPQFNQVAQVPFVNEPLNLPQWSTPDSPFASVMREFEQNQDDLFRQARQEGEAMAPEYSKADIAAATAREVGARGGVDEVRQAEMANRVQQDQKGFVSNILQLLEQGKQDDAIAQARQFISDNKKGAPPIATPQLSQAVSTAQQVGQRPAETEASGARAGAGSRAVQAAPSTGPATQGGAPPGPFVNPGVGGEVDAAARPSESSAPRGSDELVQYADGGVASQPRQERAVGTAGLAGDSRPVSDQSGGVGSPGGTRPPNGVGGDAAPSSGLGPNPSGGIARPNLPQGPMPDRTVTKTVSPQELIRSARDIAGMIVRGETTAPNIFQRARNAINGTDATRIVYSNQGTGAFHGKRGVIEIRKPTEKGAETAYHEVGHALGRNTSFLGSPSQEMLDELELLGTPGNPAVPTKTGIGSSWKQGDSVEYQRGEGMAEFFRLWSQFPEQAKILAPKLTERMESYLGESGQIGQRLRQFQKDIQDREIATYAALRDAQHIREDRMRAIEAVSTEDGKIQRFTDRFHPFRRMEKTIEMHGRQLSPFERPHVLATTLKSRAAAQTAEEITALGDILTGINGEEELRQFEQYLAARHFQTMKKKGMATGYTQGMADDAIKTAKPGWDKKAEALYALQAKQLRDGVNLGMWDQAHVDQLLEEWPEYVPSNRFFELGAMELPNKGSGQRASATLQHSNPLMKIHGSSRELLSPITGVIKNTANIKLQSLKNELGNVIAKLYDEHAGGIGDYVLKVEAPEPGVDLASQNLFKVKRNGVDEYFQVSPQLYRAITDEATLADDAMSKIDQLWGNILRPMATTYNPGFALANIVRDSATIPYVTRVGGRTRVPGFPFVSGALTQIAASGINKNNRIKGLLDNPLTKMVGGVADQSEAQAALSGFKRQGGYQDFADSLIDRPKATIKAKELVTNPVRTPKDRAIGAAIGGGIGFGLAGPGGAAVGSGIGAGYGFHMAKKRLGQLTDFGEQSNRIGHFLEARRYYKTKNPKWNDAELDLMAGFEARNVQDFSRRGSSPTIKKLRQNVPFLGATVEGSRSQLEAVLTRPLQVLATGLALGVAPEAIETFWWRDDADYWNIPQEKRDRYFYLPNLAWDGTDINNKFIPIPKGQGVFLGFANATQWGYQKATDTHAPSARGMASATIRNITPGDVDPTQWDSLGNAAANLMGLAGPAGKAAGELASGRDFFLRRDIVPASVKKKHPSPVMQSGNNTSATAQAIAKTLHKVTNGAINTSPMEVDHLLYRLFAGTGQNAINSVTDPAIERVSKMVNPEEPKFTQPEARKAKSLGAAIVDAARLRYIPNRMDSVNRLEDRVTELQRLSDEGRIDPVDAEDLADMEADLGEARGLLTELRSAETAAERRSIVNKIYDLAEPWSKTRQRN